MPGMALASVCHMKLGVAVAIELEAYCGGPMPESTAETSVLKLSAVLVVFQPETTSQQQLNTVIPKAL
jgi:hypothetical protein